MGYGSPGGSGPADIGSEPGLGYGGPEGFIPSYSSNDMTLPYAGEALPPNYDFSGTNWVARDLLNSIVGGLKKFAGGFLGNLANNATGIPIAGVLLSALINKGTPLTDAEMDKMADSIIRSGGVGSTDTAYVKRNADGTGWLMTNPVSSSGTPLRGKDLFEWQQMYPRKLTQRDMADVGSAGYRLVDITPTAKTSTDNQLPRNTLQQIAQDNATSQTNASAPIGANTGGSGMASSGASQTSTRTPAPRDPEQQALFDSWWQAQQKREQQIAEDTAYKKEQDQGFIGDINNAFNSLYGAEKPMNDSLNAVASQPASNISFQGPGGTLTSPFIPGSQRYAQRTYGSNLQDLYNKYLANRLTGLGLSSTHTPNEASTAYYNEMTPLMTANENRRYGLPTTTSTADYQPSTLDTIGAWLDIGKKTGITDAFSQALNDWINS